MDLQKFAEEKFDELLRLHKELCLIPAPSHFEDERAEFILKYLKDAGFEDAYIDEAKNVICSLGKPSEKIVVLGDGIPDPYGGNIETYMMCANSIRTALNEQIDEIVSEA